MAVDRSGRATPLASAVDTAATRTRTRREHEATPLAVVTQLARVPTSKVGSCRFKSCRPCKAQTDSKSAQNLEQTVTELEPVTYDSMGVPRYSWQVGERLDESVRARLKQMIDDNQA